MEKINFEDLRKKGMSQRLHLLVQTRRKIKQEIEASKHPYKEELPHWDYLEEIFTEMGATLEEAEPHELRSFFRSMYMH